MSLPSSSIAAAILMGTLFAVACTESQSTSPTVPSVLSPSTVDAPSSRTSPQLGFALNGSGTLVVDDDGADCANAVYKTIQAAVTAAEVGTTILVCAGTYNERVVIEKNGLRLLAKGAPDTVVLDGNLPLPFTPLNHAFHLLNVSDVLIEGFTVREYFENIKMTGGGGNTVRKNRTTAAGHDGIIAFNSADNLIEHNVSFDNPSGNACGVNIAGPGSVGNIIRHNTLINNRWGINIQSGATNTVAFNNESRGNRSHGILNRFAATGSTIENNRVENNPVGIEINASLGATVARNHAFHNTTFDLVDAGVNNTFVNNHCETSAPPGLCEHSEGASK